MARPLRIQYPGAFYHVTARGNEQRNIYKSNRDREKFLSYLQSATERYGAVIHAYCLMDNHYHLLLETPDANLSHIMQHVNGAYTTYYNIKRKRFGHLLQGRYKAIIVDRDAYAQELSRYIHLNPVRIGKVKRADDYLWSSCKEYYGKRISPSWLKIDFILSLFGKKPHKQYQCFIEDGQDTRPLDDVVASTILGGEKFVAEIMTQLSERQDERDQPTLRKLHVRPTIEEIAKIAKELSAQEPRLQKRLGLYLCHKYSGQKLRTIGEKYGVSESGVTRASSRFLKELATDDGLQMRLSMALREYDLSIAQV